MPPPTTLAAQQSNAIAAVAASLAPPVPTLDQVRAAEQQIAALSVVLSALRKALDNATSIALVSPTAEACLTGLNDELDAIRGRVFEADCIIERFVIAADRVQEDADEAAWQAEQSARDADETARDYAAEMRAGARDDMHRIFGEHA